MNTLYIKTMEVLFDLTFGTLGKMLQVVADRRCSRLRVYTPEGYKRGMIRR